MSSQKKTLWVYIYPEPIRQRCMVLGSFLKIGFVLLTKYYEIGKSSSNKLVASIEYQRTDKGFVLAAVANAKQYAEEEGYSAIIVVKSDKEGNARIIEKASIS